MCVASDTTTRSFACSEVSGSLIPVTFAFNWGLKARHGCRHVELDLGDVRGSPSFCESSVQFSSVAHSCPTLCNPMDCRTPGLLVHHQLPEFTQTHIHQVSDPSNHLILCPLLLLPSIFPSFKGFSNETVLCFKWWKYWSFSFNISPSNEYSGWFPLGWTGLISLLSKGLSRVLFNTTVQKHQFFSAQLSWWSNSHKIKC